MRPRHLWRCKSVWIEFAGTRQNHLTSKLIAFGQRHQIATVDDFLQFFVFYVEFPEPLRVQLTNGEIFFQHFACGGNGELLRAQETQQKYRIGAAFFDVRMFRQPFTELGQGLRTNIVIFAQFFFRHLFEMGIQIAYIRIVVVGWFANDEGWYGFSLQHWNGFWEEFCNLKSISITNSLW